MRGKGIQELVAAIAEANEAKANTIIAAEDGWTSTSDRRQRTRGSLLSESPTIDLGCHGWTPSGVVNYSSTMTLRESNPPDGRDQSTFN
jgi:hypothetical protein